jgi:hypothetical protein
MLDRNFQDPAQQQRLSHQKMKAIEILMDETLLNPDTENIRKLKDFMGVLSDPPEYNTAE